MKALKSIFFTFFFAGVLIGQEKKKIIEWLPVSAIKPNKDASVKYFLNFPGATYTSASDAMPLYSQIISIPENASKVSVKLKNEIYAVLADSEIAAINISRISENIIIESIIEPAKPNAIVNFIPLRKNSATGDYEKLISFEIETVPIEFNKRVSITPRVYAANSILAIGDWHKIGVTKDGIHKIDRNLLSKLGIDVNNIDPRNIQLFGNGGGMLPYMTTGYKIDDLKENAIHVEGEVDGVFDQNDYVLFYGQSPHRWIYNSTLKRFTRQTHDYSDTTYYFLTVGNASGKRIQTQSSVSGPGTTVTTFNDYALHESDAVNLIRSGREWYGEQFNNINSYSFSFNFPNISDTVFVVTDLCSRHFNNNPAISYTTSSGIKSSTITDSGMTSNIVFEDMYCREINYKFNYTPLSSTQNISVTKNGSYGTGWLNYVELNTRRSLTVAGNQMAFRDIRSASPGKISEFFLSNANSQIKVWEITDPLNIRVQNTVLSGSVLSFIINTDSLREFIAFNGTEYFTPQFHGKVSNQNLHFYGPAEYIIITHPDFKKQAVDIANIHSDLTSIIVTPQEIYNEFSSGAQDITAIRDFVKMIYDRSASSSTKLKYLLLLGDGSYNNKNRSTKNTGNTNFIPTFQSFNSTIRTQSYVSDDYYGILEDDEGSWAVNNSTSDNIDIGIGRLPVKNAAEADGVVKKVLSYLKTESINIKEDCNNSATGNVHGDWRNIICFMADDEDGNLHLGQADYLADQVEKNYRNYNIDKIYLDAYQQYAVAGGERYPDATEAMNRRIDKGALIMNYTGHGGELGLTAERFLEMYHVNGWTNYNKLPLFVTATCEFARFDDPGLTSAGENVLLNSKGGGIALLTTLRVVYASNNFTLNKNFYDSAFAEVNGVMPALGDLYRKTKNATGADVNTRNFTLLGDPALTLAYPKHTVVTTSVNSISATDTVNLQALSKVTVSGYLTDKNNLKLSTFNGLIYPTVFDKALDISTLANDAGSSKELFRLQKNVLYKGKASVTKGDFTFSFIIPKDISFKDGPGRISYYAHNGIDDASGYFEKIKISGTDSTAAIDNQGPQLDLYMNDSNFVFGGTTNEAPQIFAVVRDSNGISTAGTAIGHDIAAILDGNTEKAIVLNDYYEADLNSYKSGKVRYNLSGLSEGNHNLKIKVWDVYNNSSQAYTEFVVAKSARLALNHVLNYPNPFTTKTKFFFEHNRACEDLDVQIQVFTVSGKLVKTIDEFIRCEGFRSDGINWDGRDDFGDKIGRGVYVYRLRVRTPEGEIADKFEKLVILN